jgi:23S rRNA G2445 N2-methylase RlmL
VVWTGRGHRRADTWKLAAEVARRAPELVNDPRDAPWTARVAVDPGAARVTLELVPRRDADPRFAWRQGDVPAASHPTLAAALARVAGARPDDVVWDPFVGSGSELVERARLGPARALVGTDLDEQALAVAARNLAAAGVRAELVRADACAYRPSPAPTLVITNPPMGRRVARGELGPLLGRFVAHVAHVLAPGGRLVWLTPMPRVTDAAAARAGLVAERDHDVDMGGFSARLQVLRAPRRASAAR